MVEWLGLSSTTFLQRETENTDETEGKAFLQLCFKLRTDSWMLFTNAL